MIADQHEFNRDRWVVIEADEKLAKLEQKIETDRFGNVVMMPPPGFNHSSLQGLVIELLRDHVDKDSGRVLPECPVSTSDGVKGVDVVWISHQRIETAVDGNLLVMAPEICIEILSPGNTREEISKKKVLYFEAGAEEVWLVSGNGEVGFYQRSEIEKAQESSSLVPSIPGSLL